MLESARIEAHYKTLTTRRSAHELLGALELLRLHLDAEAGKTEARLEGQPMCYNQRATPEARILEKLCRKYYEAVSTLSFARAPSIAYLAEADQPLGNGATSR